MIGKSSTTPRAGRILALVVLAIAVGLAFISRQSFWMDEGGPAFRALMPTVRDWWDMTMRLGGSDAQMPVYMFSLWAWEKLAGHGEFVMRAINLPWLVITVLALRNIRWWPLVCLTSPFVLYYVGELRPYGMQIAAGALAAAAMIKAAEKNPEKPLGGLHATALASLLLSASSLTGAVWAIGLWSGVLIMRPDWLGRKDFWIRLSPWILGAGVLAAYYIFTLYQGFRAAAVDGAGILSELFGFYEMIGLLGLGPGKNDLRGSVHSLLSYLPILLPAFLAIAGAWLYGAGSWMKGTSKKNIAAAACAVLLPILILTVVGFKMDFRVLGRHFSPAIPAVLLPIALSLAGAGRWKVPGQILAGLAICFAFASAVVLRTSERHARDDFRQASAIVLDAMEKKQSIWWQADMNCLRYYAYVKGGARLIHAVQVFESDPPSSLLSVDRIFINRPDLRYPGKNHQAEFKRNFFHLEHQLTGFEIWSSIPN